MPTAIIAGLPPDTDRRVQQFLKEHTPFPSLWRVTWFRSNGQIPGLAPSQLQEVAQQAASACRAHLLVFRGRPKKEEERVLSKISLYFRMRWIEVALLKLIPHSMERFLDAINLLLNEELEWSETVKPKDDSCCLLLPECTFSAASEVRHIWTAASERGTERIKLAARACKRFQTVHWLTHRNGSRAWIDSVDRVFDHRGARHGMAPFPRQWKFSYQATPGFHFDVTSRSSRDFIVHASDGDRYPRPGSGHVNIDPHGYVRD
jgi:hypothetical protein